MHFLDEIIASGGTIVALEDRIFLAGNPNENAAEDHLHLVNSGIMTAPLIEKDPDSLWSAYESENRLDFEARVTREAEEMVRTAFSDAMPALIGVERLNNNLLIALKIALFEVGAYFMPRPQGLVGRILAGEKDVTKTAVLDYLESALECGPVVIAPEKMADVKTRISDTAHVVPPVDYIKRRLRAELKSIGVKGILYTNNTTYTLTLQKPDTKLGERDTFVCVGGRIFVIKDHVDSRILSLDQLFANYLDLRVGSQSAVRAMENLEGLAAAYPRELGIFRAILKSGKKDFDFGNWGIRLQEQDACVTVYLRVPQFALMRKAASGDEYYIFPESKIGVNVFADASSQSAFYLENTPNPGGYPAGNGICVDPKPGNDMPGPVQLINTLVRTVTFVQANNDFRISQGRKATLQEVQELSIPITNKK